MMTCPPTELQNITISFFHLLTRYVYIHGKRELEYIGPFVECIVTTNTDYHLECHSCFKRYFYTDSDAKTASMFCSKACEELEEQRLKEGNEIVDKAKAENPEAFTQSKVSVLPTHPEGILRMINFNKQPIKEESEED